MQINSVNTNNNHSQSFGRVFFHNKKELAKLSRDVIDSLLDSEAVKEFSKRKDYDLFIKTNTNLKIFKYKIKSVGQGIQGIINNFVAPWRKLYTTSFEKGEYDLYLEMWHPSKQEVKLSRELSKKEAVERKNRLAQMRLEEKFRQKEHIKLLKDIEKQLNNK